MKFLFFAALLIFQSLPAQAQLPTLCEKERQAFDSLATLGEENIYFFSKQKIQAAINSFSDLKPFDEKEMEADARKIDELANWDQLEGALKDKYCITVRLKFLSAFASSLTLGDLGKAHRDEVNKIIKTHLTGAVNRNMIGLKVYTVILDDAAKNKVFRVTNAADQINDFRKKVNSKSKELSDRMMDTVFHRPTLKGYVLLIWDRFVKNVKDPMQDNFKRYLSFDAFKREMKSEVGESQILSQEFHQLVTRLYTE